jgi:hypothetical protein
MLALNPLRLLQVQTQWQAQKSAKRLAVVLRHYKGDSKRYKKRCTRCSNGGLDDEKAACEGGFFAGLDGMKIRRN